MQGDKMIIELLLILAAAAILYTFDILPQIWRFKAFRSSAHHDDGKTRQGEVKREVDSSTDESQEMNKNMKQEKDLRTPKPMGRISPMTISPLIESTSSYVQPRRSTTTSMPQTVANQDGKFKKARDDTITEMLHDKVNLYMKSVGALVAGDCCGTVFRAGSRYVITAYHVLKPIIDPWDNGDIRYARLEKEDVFVNFSPSYTHPSHIFHLTKNVPFVDVELDIAVLELEQGSANLPLQLPLYEREVPNIGELTFIGFGKGNTKKYEDPNCKVIPEDKRSILVSSAVAWVQKLNAPLGSGGYDVVDVNHRYLLNCTMEHGASGAPGLAFRNGREAAVVAVLIGGTPEFFWNLPNVDKQQYPIEYRFEYATKCSHIYERMKQMSPEVCSDIFETDEMDIDY